MYKYVLRVAAFLFSGAWMPVLLYAQTPADKAAAKAAGFVDTFNEIILYPTIALLTAVAFFVFLWGCAEYFMNATNDQARQQGVKHITYGFIGLLIMITAFTILTIATATFGLDDELNCADNPGDPGCSGAFTLP